MKSFVPTVIVLKYLILLSLFLSWTLTGPACSARKIPSIPASLINSCPYEHYPVNAGPITEETINNILLNHDLDHKCIDYLKDLLGRIKKEKVQHKDEENFFTLDLLEEPTTLFWVVPQATYYVRGYGFTNEENAKITEAMDAWNKVLPRDVLRPAYLASTANILLMKWPLDRNILGLAYPSGPVCLIQMREDLPPEMYSEVVSHELGHCVGLAHRNDPESLMHPMAITGSPNPDPISVGILQDFNPFF